MPEEVETNLRNNYKILQKGVRITAHSPNIPAKIIREMMMPVDSVQEELDTTLQVYKFLPGKTPKF